jgi:hypothetical protein
MAPAFAQSFGAASRRDKWKKATDGTLETPEIRMETPVSGKVV